MRALALILLTACSGSSSIAPSNPFTAGSGTATLSWVAPTTTVTGAPLGLVSYRVYYGTGALDHMFPTSLTSAVVEQLGPGTWSFAVTAVDSSGESAFSNVVQKTV